MSFYERRHIEDQMKKDPQLAAADIAVMTDTEFEDLKSKTEKSIRWFGTH